jgi:transcriptional regulator with XRE-family HTH domain
MYERLDNLLKKRGITPYRLSKDLGISQSCLSEWKRGNSIPKHERLVKIAAYLGVPESYLTGREDLDLPDIQPATEAGKSELANKELLEQLMTLVKEKLAVPEWSDEQAKQNLELFNSLSAEKKQEALRYLRFLLTQQEAEKQ